MDYLMSPIRRELAARIAHANTGFVDSLVIDFNKGSLAPDKMGNVQFCSLLESDAPGVGILSTYTDQSLDCVVVNLQLSWLDFQALISELRRLLRPGGSLYFSAFGPDTLGEIYNGWVKVDDLPHVHPFVDMHYLGDALLKAGFIQPIVDADWIYVDYPGLDVVIEDLKQEGFANILSDRRKTLTGVQRFRKFNEEVNNVAKNGDKINITYEIIYGYAKSPAQSDTAIRVMPPLQK